MENNKNNYPINPLYRFWRLLAPDRLEIRNIYIYATFNGLVSLSLPLGIQAIINLIQGGIISTAWIVLVCVVVAGVAVSGLLSIYQMRLTENLQQKIFTRASFEFSYRLPKIRMEAIYKHYVPELMNRFFDTTSVQKGLSKILIDFSSATVQTLFGLMLLSLYHPFFIAFSIVLALFVYVTFKLTANKGLETSLAESKSKYQMAHWLEELARTITTFKLTANTNLHLERTDKHAIDYLHNRERHFKILVSQYSLLVFFKVVITASLLAIGGILVMHQKMNIGQFIAAELIILLIMNSVEKLIASLETIYDVLTALEKIGYVTDLELEKEKGTDLSPYCENKGLQVDIKNVGFSYPGKNSKSLNNLSVSLSPGDKVLVTGTNNSGKSTFLYLLAGLYDIHEGSISYNGLPKGSLSLATLRSAIGHCFTEDELFQGTILENIGMGKEQVSLKDVKWAATNLHLNSFIEGLPNGYDTIIDPQGKKLPRSIVQKLLLARSIVGNPKLLLLDNNFEHIDDKEYDQIVDFLTSPENNWTLVVVSSNPYTTTGQFHKLIVMDEGQIIKSGPYQELQLS